MTTICALICYKTGVARVVVTAITGLFLYIGVRVGQEGSTTEIVVLLALLGAAAACTALAWWEATIGGLALVLVGVALAVFFIVVGGDDGLLLAGVFGAPYLLAGLLLFVGSVRGASRQRAADGERAYLHA